MGFEDQLLRQADNLHEKKQTFKNENYLDKLLALANKATRIDHINPNDFRDLYGDDNVDRDLSWVKKQDELHQQRNTEAEIHNKKIADVLEAIFHEQIELNEYFGPRVNTIKTCDYDDYLNHVDTILEIVDPEKRNPDYSGIAIDVTSASNLDSLNKKVQRILKNIDHDKLARIKYFQSEASNFRGEIKNVPLFIIGCDVRHAEEIAKLWEDGQQRALAGHPIQAILLRQIVEQAKRFRDYAKSIGRENIAEIYDQIFKDFIGIAKEKEKTLLEINKDPQKREYINNDNVLNNLSELITQYVNDSKRSSR
ncbi:MAG TPA: hypothetical protein PKN62_01460 [bacterium]|nr:hypothetical protein [bacterium]